MTSVPSVLIVDDQVGDIGGLIDFIQKRGYVVVLATNEEAARQQLDSVQEGRSSYALAIIDVMVSIKDLKDLMVETLDEQFFEDSKETGIRLCRYARKELGLSADKLPIISITAREDQNVKNAMNELGIQIFNRGPETDIRWFIERQLPVVGS